MINRIRDTERFLLVKTGINPKQTARNIYAIALEHDGKPADFKESGANALLRASVFLIYTWHALECIENEILEDLGLVGGAVGDGSLADIQDLNTEESLRLFNINFALLECNKARRQVREVINEWSTRTKQ